MKRIILRDESACITIPFGEIELDIDILFDYTGPVAATHDDPPEDAEFTLLSAEWTDDEGKVFDVSFLPVDWYASCQDGDLLSGDDWEE